MTDGVLEEQARYYAERAGEYDDWWHRRGRYDRGPDATARWRSEAAQVETALERFTPRGRVLELACGTGLWTQHLARQAAHVTALDASAEVLALAADRLRADRRSHRVDLVRADLFAWEPDRGYDAVVFAFWLSHVPEARFDRFWAMVERALEPGAQAFVVDSLRTERSTSADHVLPGEGEETMIRRLDDGREFRIVKRFHTPERLRARLEAIGFASDLRSSGEFFLYGTVWPGGGGAP